MNTLVNLPKTKRGQATLDRICSSAEQLFFKKGYHATSINDITYKAKVAPGTFYIYFTDKKLFIEYYTEFAQYYIEHIQRAQAEGQMRDHDPEVVAYLLMGVSNFIGLNWIMFKETTEFDDVVDKVIKALDEGLF